MTERRTDSISVRVDMDLTPELAAQWADHLRELLIHGPADISDDNGWDVHTAGLSALVARCLDRQFSPFAELQIVIDDDGALDDDYVWFGKAIEKPTTVLCVRDPDASNEFTIDGDGGAVHVIDVDLGRADLFFWQEFGPWANRHLTEAASLPEDSSIRQRIEAIVWSIFEENSENDEFPEAEDLAQLHDAVRDL